MEKLAYELLPSLSFALGDLEGDKRKVFLLSANQAPMSLFATDDKTEAAAWVTAGTKGLVVLLARE